MELKRCPFCGYDKPKMTTKRSGGNVRTGDFKQIICGRCKGRGPVFGYRYDKIPEWYNIKTTRTPKDAEELAIEAWNRRD